MVYHKLEKMLSKVKCSKKWLGQVKNYQEMIFKLDSFIVKYVLYHLKSGMYPEEILTWRIFLEIDLIVLSFVLDSFKSI